MSKYLINFIIFFLVAAVGVFIYQQWFGQDKETEPLYQLEIDMKQEEAISGLSAEQVEGLEIEVLQEGKGSEAENGDDVSVHYTGWLADGSKFDSSLDKGKPFSFVLGAGRVIQGWDLGVLGMKVGEKRRLTIAPELGYGEIQQPGIPVNSTLIFEVELLNVN